MSEQPTAFYDDLGVVPDEAFASDLRGRLDERLSVISHATTPALPGEEVHEMTITTVPPEPDTSSRHRRRIGILAAAAAAVVAVGAGAFIAGSDGDDGAVTPVESVPTTQSIAPVVPVVPVPSTGPPTSTTIQDQSQAGLTDQQIADEILLAVGEYHVDRTFAVDGSVGLVATIASTLPECDGYELAFENPDRPARVASRSFHRADEANPQYVLVFPEESTAQTVYEILVGPSFWASCGLAYARTAAGAEAASPTVPALPWSISDTSETVDPPELEPVGDESTTLAVDNVLGPVYFSVVRVGRAVVTLETAGQRDSNGAVFTSEQIQSALETVVSRATEALAGGRSSEGVDDGFRASSVLLDDADFDFRDFRATITHPVRMDGTVAAGLPACAPFVDTVFESEARPATVAYATFYSGSIPSMLPNYVVVHPTERQATAMLDGMQDPTFREQCVHAYYTTLPTRLAEIEYWFPFFVGEELSPPVIEVDTDDILVRRYRSSWTDDDGVVHGPEEFAYAAVRVGRIVASIEVQLEDSSGAEVTSVQEFEQVVRTLAARAEAAQ